METETPEPLIASCLLAAALPALATDIEAPPAALSKPTLVEAAAPVEALDPVSRNVALGGPQGGLFPVRASDEVKNLGNVKKGDAAHVKHCRSIAVDVVPREGREREPDPR